MRGDNLQLTRPEIGDGLAELPRNHPTRCVPMKRIHPEIYYVCLIKSLGVNKPNHVAEPSVQSQKRGPAR
jgi:hypothetical protein